MQNNTPTPTFNCPTCEAKIEPVAGMVAMKCPYCGNTIVIPESVRTILQYPNNATYNAPVSSYTPSVNPSQPPEYIPSLTDVTNLAKQGKLEEAAKAYSKITGLNAKDSMFSVQSMAGIQPQAPAPTAQATPEVPRARFEPQYTPPPVINQGGYSSIPQRTVRRGRSCVSVVFQIISVIVFIVAFILPKLGNLLPENLPFEIPTDISFFSTFTEDPEPAFVKQITSFGYKGTGPGMFENARAIGVDGSGNVVVADFGTGRIQIFDANGTYISEFLPDDFERTQYSSSIAVSRDGNIYIPNGTLIHVYNENGELLNDISDSERDFEYVVLGADDVLYAVTDKDFEPTIVRFDRNGVIDLEIVNPLSNISEDVSTNGIIGVDNFGNIYYCDAFNPVILKFSPSGEFIGQFGGDSPAGEGYTPGKFVNPLQIETDNQNRIYVVDFFNIQVFDTNMNYLARIEGGYYGVAFNAQNNMYGTSTLDNNVVKFEIQPPSQ
ncbi:MAG: NHL repeat-containing protein [Anaerolineales bacterium]|nr:NHL repeat-containing protein [Anaerolineales bacterium]